MPEFTTVTRRNAALVIATSLTASATVAASMHNNSAVAAETTAAAIDDGHRQIAVLLQGVRRAQGTAAVTRAFERCKAALRTHELCEASILAGDSQVREAVNNVPASLYRYADPSTVLARVIVRELDALPNGDSSWMQRFADLEAAFAVHVGTASIA